MSGPHFQLHPQLARDTFPVVALTLSELLLMNDSRFPWCILVPRLPDLSGLHELPVNRRERLFDEISRVSRVLLTEPRVQRINVGARGHSRGWRERQSSSPPRTRGGSQIFSHRCSRR